MHHAQLKSAVKKYLPMKHFDNKELAETIQKDEKGYTWDEVKEILAAIKEAEPVAVAASIAGKKLYDIWKGSWVATKKMGIPGGGQELVLEWKFLKEGLKALVTNVPCEPEKAKEFNEGKRLRAGRILTEQMIEVGYTGDILDVVPNPYAVQEIYN